MMDNDYDLNFKSDGELYLINKLVSKAPKFSVVFDLGGEKGDWTNFVENNRNDLTIHIFVAYPLMYESIQARFSQKKNIIINNVAVSDSDGFSDFYEDTYSIHKRKSVFRDKGIPISVRTITLDNYINENDIQEVFFMKMDIEGNEPFALRGAKNSIKDGIFCYIQFEYGGCNIDSRTYLKDFYEIFEGTPYRIGKIHPKHIEYIEKYDRLRENFYDGNWIASRVDC
ncbi:MAG: FkbM family methyltransferase [Ignavibacteriaceae bacterium]